MNDPEKLARVATKHNLLAGRVRDLQAELVVSANSVNRNLAYLRDEIRWAKRCMVLLGLITLILAGGYAITK